MPDFAGAVSVSGRPVSPAEVRALQSPFHGRRFAEHRSHSIALVQADRSRMDGRGEAPVVARAGGRFFVGDVRIDNADELRRYVNGVAGSDDALILALHEADARRFPRGVIGDFSLAIWSEAEQSLLCARDHFGVRPFYYAVADGLFVFSSDIRSLTALGGSLREPDNVRVAEFLEGVPTNEERTFYKRIKRLPPASRLTLKSGHTSIDRYATVEGENGPSGDVSGYDAVDRFRAIFLESVKCRLGDGVRVGSLLSGGLDSSSVTCSARELMDATQPLTTFSAIFPGIEEPHRAMIDERPFIDAVCELDGLSSVRVEADRLTPLDGLEELIQIHGQPFDPPNAYLDFAMSRVAGEHKVDVLLDGLEGDITVSHGVHYLDELAFRGRWAELLRQADQIESRLQLRRDTVFRKYGLARMASESALGMAGGIFRLLLAGRTELAARVLRERMRRRRAPGAGGPGPRVISADLAETVDWLNRPEEILEEHFVSERQAHRAFLRKPYIPSIMEFTHANGRHFGVDVRHPLFDTRIASFCVDLAPALKLRDGWTRYILRAAMRGIVPDTVRWRPGKATLAPNFDLRMALEANGALEALLRDAEPILSDFAQMDVIWTFFRQGRFRAIWPAAVLASFLKKSL